MPYMYIFLHVHVLTVNIAQLIVPKVENLEVVLGLGAKLGDAFQIIETKVKEGHTVYALEGKRERERERERGAT